MTPLTLQQIEAILAQALADGLEPSEIEGLRAALLVRAAQPDNVDKLRISIATLPTAQADSVNAFVDALSSVRQKQLSHAKADLMSMSDKEWQALVDEANGTENATGEG